MVWVDGVNNCCKSNKDCKKRYPKEYPICDTETERCKEKCKPGQ